MRIFLILLTTCFIFSCSSDDDDNSNGQEETFTYTFSENSEIQVTTTQNGEGDDVFVATIEAGEKLVFTYRYSLKEDPEIADSGFGESIIFEIDPPISSFSFTNEELLASKAYYDQSCFCQFIGSIPISNGTISGTKLSNGNWDIDINISWQGNIELVPEQASGVFIPE